MRTSLGILTASLLVLVGCGDPPTEIASNSPDRPKAAWMRGVNLTSEAITVNSQRFSLLTDAAPDTGSPFTPVPPKPAKLKIVAGGKTSEADVVGNSDVALSVLLVSEAGKVNAVVADLGEARQAKAGAGSLAFISVDAGVATKIAGDQVTIDGKPAGTEFNVEVTPGHHKITIKTAKKRISIEADVEADAAYSIVVLPSQGKAVPVRNSTSSKPQAQSAG